jgi:hypothetical protein
MAALKQFLWSVGHGVLYMKKTICFNFYKEKWQSRAEQSRAKQSNTKPCFLYLL